MDPRTAQFYTANATDLARRYIAAGSAPARYFPIAFNLRRILKPGGRLLISTPLVGPATDPDTHRDPDGRLFHGVTPENFHFLLEKVGFHRINRWDEDDTLGRMDRRWATQLFVLEGAGSRSLDQIEAILNRDKKDATYKPALFRALAELATTTGKGAAKASLAARFLLLR